MNEMSEKKEYYIRPVNEKLAAKLMRAVWVLTFIVVGLIVAMRQIKIPLPEGVSFKFLPAVNAILNSSVTVLLVSAFIAIVCGRVKWHQRLMTGAVALSVAFLVCYVAYHLTSEETKFGGEGASRIVYFVILATHVVLAAVSFPFILKTLVLAWTNQYERHRRLARRIYPVWLYVAATGPIVYWMLKPYY